MARKAYDHLFKLLLIGDSAVGKTCILLRWVCLWFFFLINKSFFSSVHDIGVRNHDIMNSQKKSFVLFCFVLITCNQIHEQSCDNYESKCWVDFFLRQNKKLVFLVSLLVICKFDWILNFDVRIFFFFLTEKINLLLVQQKNVDQSNFFFSVLNWK